MVRSPGYDRLVDRARLGGLACQPQQLAEQLLQAQVVGSPLQQGPELPFRLAELPLVAQHERELEPGRIMVRPEGKRGAVGGRGLLPPPKIAQAVAEVDPGADMTGAQLRGPTVGRDRPPIVPLIL